MKRWLAWSLIAFFFVVLPIGLAGVSVLPTARSLSVETITPHTDAQMIWLLVAAVLVLLMQAGFLSFESASVQPKHAQSVAIKNFLNFLSAGFGYVIFGFGLMFGASMGGDGWFGVTRFPWNGFTSYEYCLLAYESGLAAVAATIVSSALVERSNIYTNVVFSFLVGAIIHPLFGHWAWCPWGEGEFFSTALSSAYQSMGWLNSLGFHDFAGSTVVHCIGGFAALAGVIVLGPRKHRPGPFTGNLPLATIGVFFLWIGWIGFNGGSVLDVESAGHVILNTNLAAIAAGLMGLAYLRITQRLALWQLVLVAAMGGLVAITAGSKRLVWWEALVVGAAAGPCTIEIAITFAHGVFARSKGRPRTPPPRLVMSCAFAAIIGGVAIVDLALVIATEQVKVGGRLQAALGSPVITVASFAVGSVATYYLSRMIVRKCSGLKIDDPVNAIAIHGFAGAMGTLMVGALGHARLSAQIAGVSVAIAWSFCVSYIVFRALNTLGSLRVSDAEEEKGIGLKGMGFETLPFWTDYESLADYAAKEEHLSKETQRVEEHLLSHMTNVSHQVLSPLGGAIGLLKNLSAEADQDPAAVTGDSGIAQLKSATDFAEIAAYAVGNMDLLAKLDRQDIAHRRDLVSMTAIAGETASLFKFLAKINHIRIEWNPPSVDLRIIGDRDLVKQAVMNLVDNAVHYADRGTEVKLRLQESPTKFASLCVINKGMPIDPDKREEIFERGIRGDKAATRRPDGTGIGLYIARRISEINGGRVVLATPRDNPKITEFRLELPLAGGAE